ncbi:MAG: hypothetical protein NVSMB63_09870 [Sediminibacterium sp.]
MATSFLKKNIKYSLLVLLVALLSLPLWMRLSWYLSSKRKLAIAIIDKTVLTSGGQEHISLNWILNQEKFSKNDADLYEAGKDYYGFFPLKDKKFEIKGLEQMTNRQLEDLSNDADAVYITDAYGVYNNEWYKQGDVKERSGIIYGGMSEQDIYFLEKMRSNHKLIITEFNCMGSPTTPGIRNKFQNDFGLRWTGWAGKYFNSFDTATNQDLPKWLIKNYQSNHHGQWPFNKSGIAFVNTDERVVILEKDTHLKKEMPHIHSTGEGRSHFGLPPDIAYSFWFDVVLPDTTFNHVIANFDIEANDRGKEELRNNGLPVSFAAVTTHLNKDYRFFYFSGNFCDNPVSLSSSYFKKVNYFNWLLYNTHDPLDRRHFFWTFYRPLVTTILNDYHVSLQQH